MIERSTGIILRTHPLTETSLIVNWLTRDLGRISTVAKGARRTESPFRGKLDLFYEAELTLTRSRRSELHTLREVNLLETHEPLRRDMHALRQAAYAARLIEQVTETETPISAWHELMRELLEQLREPRAGGIRLYAFEMKALNEMGLQPQLEESALSPGTRQILSRLAEPGWTGMRNLQPSAAQSREIALYLHGYLVYHLGRVPHGRGDIVHE